MNDQRSTTDQLRDAAGILFRALVDALKRTFRGRSQVRIDRALEELRQLTAMQAASRRADSRTCLTCRHTLAQDPGPGVICIDGCGLARWALPAERAGE